MEKDTKYKRLDLLSQGDEIPSEPVLVKEGRGKENLFLIYLF